MKFVVPLSVLVITIVIATGNNVAKSENSAKSIEDKNPVISVEAGILKDIAIYPEYKAPATVLTLNDSQISAELAAVVERIVVEVGQVVKKGDLLVSLRKKDFQLALQREQAALDVLRVKIEFADYQVQRAQKLQKQQAVAEELLKQRETDLAVLVSESHSRMIALRQAKRNLAKCDLLAPYDAVIMEKFASDGELANPGTPLLRIIDAQRREVSAELQSYQLAGLRSASSLAFKNRSDSYPLTLRSVIPIVDSKKRTQEVRLKFGGARALVGTSGELVWQNKQAHVPAEMLVQRNSQLGIFIISNNRAKFVELDTAAEGRPALVDFSLDTKIVTKGRFKLQDGDSVSTL